MNYDIYYYRDRDTKNVCCARAITVSEKGTYRNKLLLSCHDTYRIHTHIHCMHNHLFLCRYT